MSNLERLGKRAAAMNNSTRITCNDVLDLCKTIHAVNPDLPVLGAQVPGLSLCVRLPLTYLRHNPPQEPLAEVYGVWQATASRVIGACTPLIAAALQEHVPAVEDLRSRRAPDCGRHPLGVLVLEGTSRA